MSCSGVKRTRLRKGPSRHPSRMMGAYQKEKLDPRVPSPTVTPKHHASWKAKAFGKVNLRSRGLGWNRTFLFVVQQLNVMYTLFWSRCQRKRF